MNIKRSAEDADKENVVLRSMVRMWEDIAEPGTPNRILSQLWLEAQKRGHACDFLFSELDRHKSEAEMLRIEIQEIKDQNLSLRADIKRMMSIRP